MQHMTCANLGVNARDRRAEAREKSMSDVASAVTTLRTTREDVRRRIVALTEQLDAAKSEDRRISRALAVLDPSVGEAATEPSFADLALREFQKADAPLSKAEMAQALGGPRSRAGYALEVLIKRGVIAPTGELKGKSPVFALAES